MSKALDPLRRLVVQFNARIAHLRVLPTTNIPPPAPSHIHAPAPTTAAASHTVPFSKPLPIFGQFQVKVPYPSHQDGPVLLAHLNRQFNSFARNFFVPEPARVAAVDYACRSAGGPKIASLLSQGSQRMMHHQPLRFAVPHGFAKNVGFFSTRGFSSGVTAFQPALNGPVKMMAQMYAKPLGSLPANAQKLSENDSQHHQLCAKRRSLNRANKAHRSGEVKKRSAVSTRLSTSVVRAFLSRAATVEQQHQIMSVCRANAPITNATAISLAKVAGKTVKDLEDLPKLNSDESCLTNVDMCFLLDASPLWHLDTMVSALHTDSLRAPKELNMGFIEDLLGITNAQYQHFLEVSAILQKLVQCPEAREITLEGYELRVHFDGTSLFDMAQFLQRLSIDPKSPHFDLEEVYMDAMMAKEQYFPQASVNDYYAPSLSDNETWDHCSSLHSSMMMYTDSELCSSVASFATLESLPVQQSPWEDVATATLNEEAETEDEDDFDDADQVAPQDQDEEAMSPWNDAASVLQESSESLDRMSSRILSSEVVNEEYFDNIHGFLDSIEAVHKHSR
ncbi:hypothetical protein BGZ58_009947, partial [Dissophora ornata]